MNPNGILFEVTKASEGGEDRDDLETMVQDAVRCHFTGGCVPDAIRLHYLEDEATAL